MYDPDLEFGPEEPTPLPSRPEPKPIRDPQQSLWVPTDLEEEALRPQPVTAKERTKHVLHLLGPTLGTLITVGVLAYIGYTLLGVYHS